MNIRRNRFRGVALVSAAVAIFAANEAATAAIIWNITYEDVTAGNNRGFADPTFGAARRNTFTAVTNYINTVINENGTVDLVINQSETDGSGALASAGSLYFTGPNGFQNGLVFQHATTGVDPFGGVEDGSATFDFGYNFNSEVDAPGAGEFDLFSIALHEVTHALGFSSLLNPDGTSGVSGADPGVFSVFDSFLVRQSGAVVTPLFAAGGNFVGTAADLVSNQIFFNGANAVAANGGNPVQIYAPNPYQDGSSLSHLDFSVPGVMQASIAPGAAGVKRSYNGVEIAILRDIGYDIQPAAVPEPGSFVLGLLVAGPALIAARRRRKASACHATTAA